VRIGGVRVPFHRVRGGAGRPDGEGNQAVSCGAKLLAIRFSGEGETEGVSGE
jgi:hypothetical protein